MSDQFGCVDEELIEQARSVMGRLRQQRQSVSRQSIGGDEEASMRVAEAMKREVKLARPEMTIEEAARTMLESDAGALPVAENDRLVGMITDRDIAVRAVARGRSPDTPVREIMSAEIKYCFDDEDVEHVARNMANQQLRRLPVVNRDKRLVGILSLGDVAITQGAARETVGEVLQAISKTGGEHSQTGQQTREPTH
jgi:CBS domain-containing protein